MSTEYWKISMSEVLADAGVSVTDAQLLAISDGAQSASQMESEATGACYIPNPLKLENESIKRDLAYEREKQTCPECKGRGSITSQGYSHSALSLCDKCRGEGKVHPSKL